MAEQSKIMSEQSKTMAEQTKQNRLSNQLQVALFLRDHYQTVNKILAEQREARDALKLNMSKVLAYMLISDYDAIYQMRNEGMIDDPKWAILEPFIRQQMKENRDIRTLWRAPGNHGRSPDFKNYVEACVYSDRFESRIRPGTPAIIIGMTQNNKAIKDWRDFQLKECPEVVHN